MTYLTTITKKGQITIPKKIRDFLKLKKGRRLEIKIEKKEIRIKPALDILDLAGKFKPKKVVDPVKIREMMAKIYKPR